MTTPTPPKIKTCKPHQLGWLRRGDLEDVLCAKHKRPVQVWEKPNGDLCYHYGPNPLIVPVEPRPRIEEWPR